MNQDHLSVSLCHGQKIKSFLFLLLLSALILSCSGSDDDPPAYLSEILDQYNLHLEGDGNRRGVERRLPEKLTDAEGGAGSSL